MPRVRRYSHKISENSPGVQKNFQSLLENLKYLKFGNIASSSDNLTEVHRIYLNWVELDCS